MSIWDVIYPWSKDGDLVVLQPEFEASESGRFVFATKAVWLDLYGTWADPALAVRYARARQVVDAFVSNSLIAARFPPSKSVKAQIALLQPTTEEVWEFRSPKPGVRVFGRFAEFNVFIATNVELREKINDDYTREKEDCKRQWRTFFPTYPPHRGSQLSDYFDNFYEVGNLANHE